MIRTADALASWGGCHYFLIWLLDSAAEIPATKNKDANELYILPSQSCQLEVFYHDGEP